MDLYLKGLNESPKIGIGITTYKRPDILSLCVAGFNKYMPPNAIVHINDDSDLGEGIATSKNRCLAALEDCDYIFLFDDDVWPCKDKWWVPFIIYSIKYKCHLFSLTITGKVIANNGPIQSIDGPNGMCMFLTNHVQKHIGGFNTLFGRYGGEHEDYARRAYNNKLTLYPNCDFDGSTTYFTILDANPGFTNTLSTRGSYDTINKQEFLKTYFLVEHTLWYPYKIDDIIIVIDITDTINPYIIEQLASTNKKHIIVYTQKQMKNMNNSPQVSYISHSECVLLNYLITNKNYINDIYIVDPNIFYNEINPSIDAASMIYNNTIYFNRIKGFERANSSILSAAYIKIPHDNIIQYFTIYMYHYLSLTNWECRALIASNFTPHPQQIISHIDVRPVIMIIGDITSKEKMRTIITKIASPLYHVVGVEYGGTDISYSESTHILTINTSNYYDAIKWIKNKWPYMSGIFNAHIGIYFIKDSSILEKYILLCNNTPSYTLLLATNKTAKGILVGCYISHGALNLITTKLESLATNKLEDMYKLLKEYNITPKMITGGVI